ncbi:MAG: hypothetical protein QOK40_3207, partial [Miltoncostaeaceae bacterium]|nr:hypothetical protein [Miltoncostaeaceae bacterium]
MATAVPLTRPLGRSWARVLALAMLAVLVALGSQARPAAAAVPAGFEDTLVTSLNAVSAVDFTPDGRILLTTRPGKLMIFESGALLATPALDLTGKICPDRERGLLGLAVDPAFATTHFIYVYYTYKRFGNCDYRTADSPVNRVSRFTLNEDTVDPATETVLVDNILSTDGNHNAGDLHVGKDGQLYVSVGDGACDWQGSALCGGQNTTSRNQFLLNGKILRITRTGGIPADNPFRGADSARCNVDGRTTADRKCQETFAWGLRNPYRIAFDPNAADTRFFINDVGQGIWEEIDLGAAGADYGWNVREGHCKNNSKTDCGPPPAGMTNPIYDYNHDAGCFAITAGAFVPNGVWPAAYDNTYLYGDFVCGTIFRLTPGTAGGFTAAEFATGLGGSSVIGMTFGPHGSSQALYYLTLVDGGQLRRIASVGSVNRAPVARAGASPASGPLDLAVGFDGSASSDPDNDPLTYDWDFGDGSGHSSLPSPSHTYTTAGTFTATLAVRDGRGGQSSATVRIDAGNSAPAPVIDAPLATKRFRVGEVITLQGHATDPDEGSLAASALSWTVVKHHDAHTHPFLGPVAGTNVSMPPGPDPEGLDALANTYLEIRLTATDAQGLSTTVTRNLLPNVVPVSLATSPSGLRLEVNGTSMTAPQTIQSWEGYGLSVNAPDQSSGGTAYGFGSWSDGGARAHTILTPTAPISATATFTAAPATALFSDGFESGNLSQWSGVTGLTVQTQHAFAGTFGAR